MALDGKEEKLRQKVRVYVFCVHVHACMYRYMHESIFNFKK